jgi:cellulose synthase/poly-beta-1,6-N-acetylglucosamine synthase-like glycosyltransferase
VLPTIALVSTAVLGVSTVLLLLLGRRVRFSSRLLGVLLAGLVVFGTATLAVRLGRFVPEYVLSGAIAATVICTVVVFVLPYWNPIGQLFLGSYLTAALGYLALAVDLTVASGLSPIGIAASVILLVLEVLAFLLSGYFAFEGCDTLCRTRPTRVVPGPDPRYVPRVCLHVPAYNEPADMLIQTVQSLERIDYPNYEILVVDNNTPDPETWRPVAEYCETRPGVRFDHVEGPGFKAGALNQVHARHLDPDVELVGVVDADYLVEPDYLRHMVGYFADPTVAFVQSPQDYREVGTDPYLTACYDAYSYFFRASMPSRNQRNSIIFAGTMGLLRRRVLEELGGWPEWCITEDSETSLRMLRAGYQGVYVDRPFGQGVMPLTFATFKSQRFRWCFGGIQILREHVRDMLPLPRRQGNRLTLGQRLDYLFGTGLVWFNDLLYLAFTAVLLVTAYLLLANRSLPFRPLQGALVLLPAALLAAGLLRALWSLRHNTGIGPRRAFLALLNWLSVSWTVAIASLQGLIRSKAVFLRTPKERDHQTLWTAIRDARSETVLAVLLWGAGVAVLVTQGLPAVFLVALFAWQGMVYASAPLMSYLNVRTVLTPELERRRRSELRRERVAAMLPYYVGGGVATVAAALVAAVLLIGGADQNGRHPPGLDVPREPHAPGLFDIFRPETTPTPTESGGPTPVPSEPATPPAPEPTGGPTTAPEPPPTPGPTSGGGGTTSPTP